MSSPNVTKLWNGSKDSVAGRIQASGFMPTSVSGGYGGITSQYPRDSSGQLIGLLEVGPQGYAAVERALEFMLSSLLEAFAPSNKFSTYAPHVMTANKNLTKIVSFDTRDQTDDTFYLITAWGRYIQLINATGHDHEMSKAADMAGKYYDLLKNYALHYLAPNARSVGFMSHGQLHGGNVLYWNSTLSLLWNPNLEHSRLGSYWSCYDTLTNAFAAEGLRVLSSVATQLKYTEDVQMWDQFRSKILAGLNSSLSFEDQVLTKGKRIYAELRGHPNDFSEDGGEVGYSPLLWGLSYENIAAVVLGISDISGVGSFANNIALNEIQLDNTWEAIDRVGSFLWVTENVEYSAFVPATHINSSGWVTPPPQGVKPPPPVTPCNPSSWLKGERALSVATGPDLCNPQEELPTGLVSGCSAITNASSCCELCSVFRSTCGAWFFNGNTTACSGHGCCYVKSEGNPDHITPPNSNFAGGYGHRSSSSTWCHYTGSFNAPPSCPAPGGKSCACASYAVIGKELGWALGWAAYRKDWTKLIVLHRWLGSASHIEQTALFAESYSYDCMKAGEASGFVPPITNSTPRGANCWGDPGNGVQIGWFLWGEALARKAVDLYS